MKNESFALPNEVAPQNLHIKSLKYHSRHNYINIDNMLRENFILSIKLIDLIKDNYLNRPNNHIYSKEKYSLISYFFIKSY